MPDPPTESIEFLDPEAVKGKFMIVRLDLKSMTHEQRSQTRKQLQHMCNRLQCRELFVLPYKLTMGMVEETKFNRIGVGFMRELELLGAEPNEEEGSKHSSS